MLKNWQKYPQHHFIFVIATAFVDVVGLQVKEALDTIEARKMFEDLGLPVDEIIRAISQAGSWLPLMCCELFTVAAVTAEQGGMLERIDYQEMLVRIDKMHLTPEKEDIWQVYLHHRLPSIFLA